MEFHHPLDITLYIEGEFTKIIGYIHYFDEGKKQITLETASMEMVMIKVEDIVDIQ
jgi:hypothetical protein